MQGLSVSICHKSESGTQVTIHTADKRFDGGGDDVAVLPHAKQRLAVAHFDFHVADGGHVGALAHGVFVVVHDGDGLVAVLAERFGGGVYRSEEHTSEFQSRGHLVC